MMRSVSYIKCKKCGRQVDVHFAHGAIEVFACKKCFNVKWRYRLSFIKRVVAKFFKNRPPRGT